MKKRSFRRPKEPKERYPGRFQYMRMELCNRGDAEEYIKDQPHKQIDKKLGQSYLFQIAFALHVAADRFSFKHYDMKLLNVFVQGIDVSESRVVMRYGLGSHIFALNMPAEHANIMKIADYGTANTQPESNGKAVNIAQFTTLENTPADFIILGDKATQGHGHDSFGLGLCMLHLFTGAAPYEEILEEVKCPSGLKKRLQMICEDESVPGYDVIRTVIMSDVYKDEAGNIVEGEPDDILYDTLYRFIVLFGIPEEKFQKKECPKVWTAISQCLEGGTASRKKGRAARKKQGGDHVQYNRDRKKYSIRSGNDTYIARARKNLEAMEGGMDLLLSLCSFDPENRPSAMDVLNSDFMASLREPADVPYGKDTAVFSYLAFSTQR